MPSADELAALPRKELQALAKTHGVKANQKNDVIIAQLLPLVAAAPAAAPAAPGGKSPSPFCSRRCADIDLGRWFQGRYAIPAVDAADDSIIETLAAADLPDRDAQ